MAEYVYEGPGPVEDEGELVHPGDVRDFEQEPDCPPWRLLQEPGAGPLSPPAPGKLAETPPHLAAQGILARGTQQATTPATGTEGGM